MVYVPLKYRTLAAFFCVALLAVCLLATEDSASAASKQRSGCDGIRLLAAPYLVVGVNDVVLDVSEPVPNRVHCERLSRRQRAGGVG